MYIHVVKKYNFELHLINEKCLISGRPYAGCSGRIRKSISLNISYIDLHSHRVCRKKLITEKCTVFILMYIFHMIL